MSGIYKKIKKYRRLRSGGMPDLKTEILREVYKSSSPELKKLYEQEMDEYIDAVESGKIKAGEPLKTI